MLSVFVTLQCRPDRRAQFLAALAANARLTVEQEPGCCRFDVVADESRSDVFHLYEIYRDADDFAQHRSYDHYEQWRVAVSECVVAGTQVVSPGQLLYSYTAESTA